MLAVHKRRHLAGQGVDGGREVKIKQPTEKSDETNKHHNDGRIGELLFHNKYDFSTYLTDKVAMLETIRIERTHYF